MACAQHYHRGIDPFLAFGDTVALTRARYFHCGRCGRKILIKSGRILPPGWSEKSRDSAFQGPIRRALDDQFSGDGKMHFDFFCKQCGAPVRLILMRGIGRKPYARVLDVVECTDGTLVADCP